MASFIERFNATKQQETLRTADLVEGNSYRLKTIKVIHTKFGKCAIAKLVDGEEDIDVFLPQRYTQLFKNGEEEEQIFENTVLIRGKPVGKSYEIKIQGSKQLK